MKGGLIIPAARAQEIQLDWFEAGSSEPSPDILWWKCNDGSGTSVAADVGPDGTTDADWSTGTQSGSGSCLNFNGTSDEAQSNSTITYGTNIITVCFWVYVDTVSGTRIFLESGPNPATNVNTWDIFQSAAQLNVYSSGTTGARQEAWNSFLTASSWIHIAAVIDQSAGSGAGDIKVYKNGSEIASSSTPTNTKTGTSNFANSTLNIGARNAASLWMDGRIDDVRIFSGELTAGQISSIYAAGSS